MDKLLKLEKYQLLHNSIYWCGMIGIFILGFFTADTYVTEVMGPTIVVQLSRHKFNIFIMNRYM